MKTLLIRNLKYMICLVIALSSQVTFADYTTGPHVRFDPNYNEPPFTDGGKGSFRTRCSFSHLNYDDPIVTPGLEAAMHLHSYFGGVGADYTTITTDLLRVASTTSTCKGGPLNSTAYWIPAVIYPVYQKDGNQTGPNRGFIIVDEKPAHEVDSGGQAIYAVVRPRPTYEEDIQGDLDPNSPNNDGALFYYKTTGYGIIDGEATRRDINAIPKDLRMIVGNPFADVEQSGFSWGCNVSERETNKAFIPACRLDNSDIDPNLGVEELLLDLPFPSCWNGVETDSENHKSHMAYTSSSPEWPTGQFCPGENTADPNDDWIRLPKITYKIFYPLTWINATPQVDPITGNVIRDDSGNLILGSSNWFLSSDRYTAYGKMQDPNHNTPSVIAKPGGYSTHGDWFMGWETEVMDDLVQHCLNEQRHCSNGELGNGYFLQYDTIVTDPSINPVFDPLQYSQNPIKQGHGNWPLSTTDVIFINGFE